MSDTVICFGLDLGTTLSGVSYVPIGLPNPQGGVLAIPWPSCPESRSNGQKIPTALGFSAVNHVPFAWGADTRRGSAVDVLTCFKLGFYTGHVLTREIQMSHHAVHVHNILLRAGIDPEDAAGLFLGHLWDFAIQRLCRVYGVDVVVKCRFVIAVTMPSGWPTESREKLCAAIRRSGRLVESNGLSVNYLSEGSASALAVLQRLVAHVAAGDAMVIADCGGATVDVVACRIRSQAPLQFEQCTLQESILAGGLIAEDAFFEVVRGKANTWSDSGSSSGSGSGQQPPLNFDGIITQWRTIIRPNLHKRGIPSFIISPSGDNNLRDGITITSVEIRAAVDKSCTERIIRCISGQVRAANAIEASTQVPTKVKHVCLVGGFGQWPYLRTQMSREFRELFASDANETYQSWNATSTGAAIHAYNLTKPSSSCSRSFLPQASRKLSANLGLVKPPGDDVWWIVKQGQEFGPDLEVYSHREVVEFEAANPVVTLRFHTSQAKRLPKCLSAGVSQVASLEFSINSEAIDFATLRSKTQLGCPVQYELDLDILVGFVLQDIACISVRYDGCPVVQDTYLPLHCLCD